MYEEMTYENIMSRMLSHVVEIDPELDTSVGSILYNAVAPMALELESAYHEMDMILAETFLDTASKEYLVKHAEQIGLSIIEATYGHYKGEFDVDVAIGSRFNLDKFNYYVADKLASPTEDNPYYVCELVCETAGSEPNGYTGNLTPITFVGGLSHAELVSVISYGEDEEETEAFRSRIKNRLQNTAVDGNISQYESWLDEYPGIGKYKVLPCWNGANTVKLVILDSENKSATPEFLNTVQEYFDPPTGTINDDINSSNYPQGRGMGNGQSPIGAIVTIDTVTEVPVTIDCIMTLKNGYESPVGVSEAVEEYLNSITLDKSVVAYMPIASAIYQAESVEDVSRLIITVKGVVMDTSVTPFISSVAIANNEIPVLDAEASIWGVG